MSTTPPEPPQRSAEPPPAPEFDIPNAEKYMLEADVMRRRQLRSALLHGSTRTWREHRKVWPGVIAGLVAGGLIIAVIAVKTAYDKDRDQQQEDELTQFCEVSFSNESLLTGDDLDLNDPNSIEEAANAAHDLAGQVPSHVADEIEKDAQTIDEQYQLMVEDDTDADRLEELNEGRELDRARDGLREFNEEHCE